MTIKKVIENATKIVVKIGSNTLAKNDGTIDSKIVESFADQCADFIRAGKKIAIVSSGAQVSGLSTISGWAHKTDIHYRQALCAIGQVELMENWRRAFFKHGIHIGQLLLTKDDFENAHRSLNIRNTLFTLIDENIVPIINENDSVATDEFSIGDNDNLSALTASLWSADLAILFSDIDGVFTENPKTNPNATLVEQVFSIENLRKKIKIGTANEFGTGGIETKLQAAQFLSEHGIPMILANGNKKNILQNISNGTANATLFFSA